MANKTKEIKRNARISVVLTENLREDLERMAKAFGFSLNDFCFKILSLAVAKNIDSVEELETTKAALDKVKADFLVQQKKAIEKFEKTFAADDGLKGANNDD